METYKHKELTNSIIQAFYCVYNELGFGFLENVYQNALYLELLKKNLKVEPQKAINVYYNNQIVGKYRADLIVNDLIILELKAVECLVEEHELQLINYLKATDKEVGLLLNFGMKPEIRRKIFDKKKISVNLSNLCYLCANNSKK
ncbi:MAG: GxxExxY protein [Prevotellaceae bacterium]|jgi:GxxExxY protein|nr:GxxExxY protein [Prevotellaceae bacterium]